MSERLINGMFHVLPAGSYKEIADRLSNLIGREVEVKEVTSAIAQLRGASPTRYGWTIPHCKRGPYISGRLFAMMVDEDGTRVLSDNDTGRLKTGLIGTLGHVHTMLGNAAEFLRTAHFKTPGQRRQANSMIRRITFVAEEAWEMREDCRNET
jgi:hypothetical protein